MFNLSWYFIVLSRRKTFFFSLSLVDSLFCENDTPLCPPPPHCTSENWNLPLVGHVRNVTAKKYAFYWFTFFLSLSLSISPSLSLSLALSLSLSLSHTHTHTHTKSFGIRMFFFLFIVLFSSVSRKEILGINSICLISLRGDNWILKINGQCLQFSLHWVVVINNLK